MTAGRSWRGLAFLALPLGLCACAATTTAIGKRDLDVQTRMTDTVFLDPVAAGQRTVFVQIRNTSDRPDFEIEPQVVARLSDRGWRVVADPERARYLLQANVLQVGRSSRTAAEQTFAQGFGGTLIGAAAGAGAGRAVSEGPGAIIGGALAGAATAAAADAFVRDVTYSVITDVQVSERAAAGVIVTERLTQDLPQGTSGSRVLSATETSEWKRYRTRILSSANQANLDFEDAAPALADGLTRAIAGIF
jgi:Enterobacterial TraT complement resistance protein